MAKSRHDDTYTTQETEAGELSISRLPALCDISHLKTKINKNIFKSLKLAGGGGARL